jgi:hypothetical protein
LTVSVDPGFGLDFKAAHIGTPYGLLLAGSHNILFMLKKPSDAANQQEGLCSAGLSPALHRAEFLFWIQLNYP